MQPRAEPRKSVKSMPPPHAHLVRCPPEDPPTTKFVRADVDDTVPFELYSQPYERVEIEARPSSPYVLIEIEQEIEFTEGFDRAPIGDAKAPSSAVRLAFTILILCGAFAVGFCFALLVA